MHYRDLSLEDQRLVDTGHSLCIQKTEQALTRCPCALKINWATIQSTSYPTKETSYFVICFKCSRVTKPTNSVEHAIQLWNTDVLLDPSNYTDSINHITT